MVLGLRAVLLAVAVILFVLSGYPPANSRVSLQSIGLAFFAGAFLAG